MGAEDEVRKASEEFYAGLTSMAKGRAEPLYAVWSHGKDVTAMHPIGDREVGWEAVRVSFEQVAGLATSGSVRLEDRRARVVGDLAYEMGHERGRIELAGTSVDIDVRVTNVYERQDGVWKMVHHHADASPAMEEVLRRLQR